jgi:hypothetical protein
MIKRHRLFLTLVYSALLSPLCLSALEEIRPVAQFLKPRELHWKPTILSYHEEGVPDIVVFSETDAQGNQIPVKQINFYPKGQPHIEMDLIVLREDEPGYKDWKNGMAPHGVCVSYYEDGKIEKIIHYDRGQLHGPVKTIYPGGELQSEGTFKMVRWKVSFLVISLMV